MLTSMYRRCSDILHNLSLVNIAYGGLKYGPEGSQCPPFFEVWTNVFPGYFTQLTVLMDQGLRCQNCFASRAN
jgi:hypothetical protein